MTTSENDVSPTLQRIGMFLFGIDLNAEEESNDH